MADQARKADEFRALHIPASANGFADGERIPLALAIENLRRIVGATDLPVTIDLESGYGDAPEEVGQTVGRAIDAGAVGCNLEDSFPTNGSLRETADQGARIRQARQTADAAGIRLFINARTDVFFQRPPEQHDAAKVGDSTPPLRELSRNGVARVSHGPRPYLLAMKALEEAARVALLSDHDPI